MTVVVRVTLIWIGLFALAFINGAFRELALKKSFTEKNLQKISSATAIVLITIFVWILWQHAGVTKWEEACIVGVYWLMLTAGAETIVISRWLSKRTWEQIFDSYDVLSGNLWPFVLIWVGLLPLAVFYLKGSALG